MADYDFTEYLVKDLGLEPQRPLHMEPRPDSLTQQSDTGDRARTLFNGIPEEPEYINEYLMPGFTALDESMKGYWSGIRIPTKDSYRFMRVKVAGGNKGLMAWRDSIVNGRVRMPVASINRTNHEFNAEKFSPPYHHLYKRYLNSNYDMIATGFRPVPYLVSYELNVIASTKTDIEHAAYQIAVRFNPMAEFFMSDGHMSGAVQLRYSGFRDASDKESGFDDISVIRYDFGMMAEAWIPLPEKIVPAIVNYISSFKDGITSENFISVLGNRNYF